MNLRFGPASVLSAGLIVFSVCDSRLIAQSAADGSAPDAEALPTHVRERDAALASRDPKVRAAAKHELYSQAVLKDLKSDDPEDRKRAVALLQRLAEGADSSLKTARSFQVVLSVWVDSLLELKQYDLVISMARIGLSRGLYEAYHVDRMQDCLTKALLAAGRDEEALSAARTYYNVCTLDNSAKAVSLVSQALIHTRMKTDPTVLDRFRQQQAYGAQGGDSPTSRPAELGDDVLASIKIDSTDYTDRIKALAAAEKVNASFDFPQLIDNGNLLLLAGDAAKAQKSFELAVYLATTSKEHVEAVSSVARAMRAADGSVARANAYLLSIQNSAAK